MADEMLHSGHDKSILFPAVVDNGRANVVEKEEVDDHLYLLNARRPRVRSAATRQAIVLLVEGV